MVLCNSNMSVAGVRVVEFGSNSNLTVNSSLSFSLNVHYLLAVSTFVVQNKFWPTATEDS